MDLMVTLSAIYSVVYAWVLGPISTVIGINKVITRIQAAVKFIMNLFRRKKAEKEKNEEPNSPPKDRPKRTYVKTVGKRTEDYTPHVSATGIRADSGLDAVDALGGIEVLETVGIERGSARTVEATGIDLRSRQTRPGEGRRDRSLGDEPQSRSFKVTGIKGGRAQTVTAVGFRF